MKKIIALLFIFFGLSQTLCAQITESFDTFTLSPNSYYQSNTGADWQSSITSPMLFGYDGNASTWLSGIVYRGRLALASRRPQPDARRPRDARDSHASPALCGLKKSS